MRLSVTASFGLAPTGKDRSNVRPDPTVDLATTSYMSFLDSPPKCHGAPPPDSRPAEAAVMAGQPEVHDRRAPSQCQSALCPAGFPAGSVAGMHLLKPFLPCVSDQPGRAFPLLLLSV